MNVVESLFISLLAVAEAIKRYVFDDWIILNYFG
jgi:hypothetical protein